MTSCSVWLAPIRLLLRNPTLGHAVMHPRQAGGHALKLTCANCLKTWPVLESFAPSPVYLHRRLVIAIKGVANVLSFGRKKAA